MGKSNSAKNGAMKAFKKSWQTLAAHQNRGWFMRTQGIVLPSNTTLLCQVPAGLDLRLSGADFHNERARLGFTRTGDTFLQCQSKTFYLGSLAGKRVELGWIITGLRLRGAVRLPEQNLILMVPDREDLPYLLRALVPSTESATGNLPLSLAA